MANATTNLLFSTANISKDVWLDNSTVRLDKWRNAKQARNNTTEYGPFFPSNKRRAVAHPDLIRAMALLTGETQEKFCVLKVGTAHYAVETAIDSGTGDTLLLTVSFGNGQVYACECNPVTNRPTAAHTIVSNQPYDCTAYMLAAITYIWEMAEDPQSIYAQVGLDKDTCLSKMPGSKDFEDIMNGTDIDAQAKAEAAFADKLIQLSVTIQFGVENGNIRMTIPNNGDVTMLTKQTISALNCQVISGDATSPIFFKTSGATNGTMTLSASKQVFSSFASRFSWTEEEKMLIPSLPDDFIVQPEAMKMAKWFVSSWDNKRPMKQFMWRGVTSYGKSTGVEAIAAMLGMPLVRMTCNTKMETQDFLSTFVPTSDADLASCADVPKLTWEAIAYDPASAYKSLTGVENDEISPEEVFELYCQKLVTAAAATSGGTRYKRVESNYVKGLIRGYLVEVQEASRIKDAGVLVGLNEFDRPGAVIPMIDGTYERRSENALVIFTDNTGYSSCRPIDPSVLRRFAVSVKPEGTKKSPEDWLNFSPALGGIHSLNQ